MKSNLPKFTKDDEFKISLSSEDINKIDEKIRKKGSDIQVQKSNNAITSDVVLLSTCTSCDIKFVPKNSITYETLCGSCIGEKVIEMGA